METLQQTLSAPEWDVGGMGLVDWETGLVEFADKFLGFEKGCRRCG